MGDNISLREYVEVRLDEMGKAITIARDQMEKRLDSMNEFRQSLRDQNTLFVTKEMHEKVEEDIRELRTFKDEQSGKASQTQVYVVWLIAILGLVLGCLALFH